MRTRSISAWISAFSMLVVSGAQAATIQSVQGNVLANRGAGYQPIADGATVNAGDKIMVPPGGSAVIVYSDGCTSTAASGVSTVGSSSPCALGQQQPAGDIPGTPGITPTTTALITGGVVLGAAGIAAAVSSNSRTGGNPASP